MRPAVRFLVYYVLQSWCQPGGRHWQTHVTDQVPEGCGVRSWSKIACLVVEPRYDLSRLLHSLLYLLIHSLSRCSLMGIAKLLDVSCWKELEKKKNFLLSGLYHLANPALRHVAQEGVGGGERRVTGAGPQLRHLAGQTEKNSQRWASDFAFICGNPLSLRPGLQQKASTPSFLPCRKEKVRRRPSRGCLRTPVTDSKSKSISGNWQALQVGTTDSV